jgi:nucleoside-diphosphate-sugar epimerase
MRSCPGTIAVSGATGFFGRALVSELVLRDYSVISLVREKVGDLLPNQRTIADLAHYGKLEPALEGVDCLIHLAGRAHAHSTGDRSDFEAHRAVNVLGTLALARAAVNARVQMMVFLSTIGVHGISTNGVPFTVHDRPAPYDAYTRTKLEAEVGLREIASKSELKVRIIRAPMIYGPNPVGNLRRLVWLASTAVPLPFANIKNRRGLISVFNLSDLILRCITRHDVDDDTFLASDNDDVSLPDLIRLIGKATSRRVRLFPVPTPALNAAFRAVGRTHDFIRLTSSLQIDIAHTMRILDWTPPHSVAEGIRRAFSADPELD